MADRPKYCLEAEFLGPIQKLEATLSDRPQNLIFARNGTGKSFLSRAFGCLDNEKQGEPLGRASFNLVSDESLDSKGSFQFKKGADVLGSLSLNRASEEETATVANTIFHVFSEDFINSELREREFKIDGEFEREITVDSKVIGLEEAEADLVKYKQDHQAQQAALGEAFETQKSRHS